MLDQFPQLEPARANAVANEPLPLVLSEQDFWIRGEPTRGDPALHPVASVGVEQRGDGTLGLTVRVALYGNTGHAGLLFTVTGWRFESAELDTMDGMTGEVIRSPRPFPHAQPTLGWYIGSNCMVHPHRSKDEAEGCSQQHWPRDVTDWRDGTNETLPGFPLRADTTVAQAVVVLVTLYGAPRTQEMLETDVELRRRVQSSPEFRGPLGYLADA